MDRSRNERRRVTREQTFGYAAFLALLVAFYSMLTMVTVADKPVKHNELYWCGVLAKKYHAEQEVRLEGGARCDLVTDKYAIEVDWAHKKFEAIGQSLFYGMKLKKSPAIILLIRDREKDQESVDDCQMVCDKYGIKLFEEDVP